MASSHKLINLDEVQYPSQSKDWGPLIRFISRCSCGWHSVECYPKLTAIHQHEMHVQSFSEPPDLTDALYQQGHMSLDATMVEFDPLDCTFGVQVNNDGRVWVCVNGVTFLRFKPAVPLDRGDHPRAMVTPTGGGLNEPEATS